MLLKVILLLSVVTVRADLTIGTDFIFAYPCFSPGEFFPSIIVINSNSNQAALTITSSLPNFTTIQQTVAGNSFLQINFTNPAVMDNIRACYSNTVKQQGFQVKSSVPIALYVYLDMPQPDPFSIEQFLVLPINMLGSQYVAYSAACPTNDNSIDGYNGIVVALHDNTRLTIGNNEVTLNQLDVYSACAATVSANMPFAFLLTSNLHNDAATVMALSTKYAFKNHVIPPPSLTNHNFMQYQIWAFEDNSVVTINGNKNVTINAGQYYNTTFGAEGGFIIASKPVQVFGDTGYLSGSFPNPILSYAYSPESFLSTSIQFYTWATDDTITSPALTIIAPVGSTGNIKVDGGAIPALQYRRIPNTQIYYYTQRFTGPATLHTISTSTSDDRYMAIVYTHDFGIYTVALNLPNSK